MCRTACSFPPMYRSTGMSWEASLLTGASEFLRAKIDQKINLGEQQFPGFLYPSYFGSKYLKKYQDESTNVSIVSVSRWASCPHFGHATFSQSWAWSRGDFPLVTRLSSSGKTTGKSDFGTGTAPQEEQWITGMGVPQYLAEETR